MVKPFIIVPLYIYPLDRAWDPLLEAARKHPSLQFVPVINPNSGPGDAELPDVNYVAALSQLSELSNIQPLGYIHCGYGNRTLDDLRREIDIYRGWNREFRIEGIFFDEAPADPDYVHFMAALADYTKTTWQDNLGEPGHVIYNPGMVVDQAFFQHPDYVVVFEQSEEQWMNYFVDQGFALINAEARQKSAAIVHSCPAKGDDDAQRLVVEHIKSFGLVGLLVTDQTGGGYTQWPTGWSRLMEIVESMDD